VFERDIVQTRALLTAMGLDKRIRIALTSGTCGGGTIPASAILPSLTATHAQAAAERQKAEANSQYTMAERRVYRRVFEPLPTPKRPCSAWPIFRPPSADAA
jgi:hypothetical protein